MPRLRIARDAQEFMLLSQVDLIDPRASQLRFPALSRLRFRYRRAKARSRRNRGGVYRCIVCVLAGWRGNDPRTLPQPASEAPSEGTLKKP